MAKTTSAAAVAERPADALWLAALPAPGFTRVGSDAPVPPAQGEVPGLPAAATDMALSRDGRLLVAAHNGADAVSIIDTADLSVRTVVDGVPEPGRLAVADRIYVTSAGIAEDAVVAIDAATGAALATKRFDAHIRGLAVSPDGGTLFAARCGDEVADIAAIGVESGALRAVPVTRTPAVAVDSLRISPDGTRLYVATATDTGDALVVIDARRRRVLKTIGCSASVDDIAVHPDGRRVVATGWDVNLGGIVTIVDAESARVIDTVALGGPSTQVVLAGRCAYVLSGHEIAVMDIVTARVTRTIAAGQPVACMTVNPEGTRLYIAYFDGTVEARAVPLADSLRAAS